MMGVYRQIRPQAGAQVGLSLISGFQGLQAWCLLSYFLLPVLMGRRAR
jgi:hypothetical protein